MPEDTEFTLAHPPGHEMDCIERSHDIDGSAGEMWHVHCKAGPMIACESIVSDYAVAMRNLERHFEHIRRSRENA